MYFLIEKFGIPLGWLLGAATVFLRYAFLSGIAFCIFYVLKRRSWLKYKIQQRFPNQKHIWSEVLHSASTAVVFALMGIGIYFARAAGYTRIYTDINTYGWAYLVLSIALMVILHDTYFYWMHRLMHHPRLFMLLHRVHHHSRNPTPWASLSFHPLEAVLEFGIIPLGICFIPFHPLALFLFTVWSLFFNVTGHLGYELFPKGFVRHPVWKWMNTSTHHNMHHQRSNCNYGLYFNFWDRVMGTNDRRYEAVFESIKSRAAASEPLVNKA